MDNKDQETHTPTMERVVINQEGPKIKDLLGSLEKRTNKLKSTRIDPVTFKGVEREFTEGEGIKDLVDFINITAETAKKTGDAEMEEKANLFLENLRFIGEEELKKATQGIAQHLVDEARNGKDIIIFSANVRSERYISLRILEEIDYLTEQAQEVRERIKTTQDTVKAARRCEDSLGNCLIAVPDDFVVSGTRIQGFGDKMYSELLNQGFNPDKASEMVEATVVAIPQRESDIKLTVGRADGQVERSMNIFSYYGIPEYRNNKGDWVVFTGISLTGSHSSTDYGFEMEIEDFQKFLKSKGVEREMPLMHTIARPYEMADGNSKVYRDNQLQNRWNRVRDKFGIKEESEPIG